MARVNRRNTGLAGLALLAILALTIGVIVGPSASASGGGATAAKKKKKKCKPGFKKVKVKVKGKIKKKCRKQATTTTPAPTPAPLVRATLTWDTDPPGNNTTAPNLDLFVFDANGAVASANSNPIGNTAFSSNDTTAPGLETFTDTLPTPARGFSFGICYAAPDIGSVHAYAKIDYVTADGQHHVVGTTDNTSSIDLGSKGGHTEFAGGPAIPAAYGGCP